MDGNRFDAISRSLADRSSRRGALRRFGGGGIGAALLGMTGMRAAAQDDEDDDEETTCRLVLVATVTAGPNKDKVYEGDLEIAIDENGAIDDGTLTTEDGHTYELVGQATGRAINMRITIEDGQYLSLTGTGQQRITRCRGAIDGTFGDASSGDLGTWYADRQERPDTKGTATATATAAAGNGNGSGNGTGGSNGTTQPNQPTTTPTPCNADIDCGSTFVLDPMTCECVCPTPYKKCGDASCCYGGAVCYDDGGCGCPDGYEPCQEVCTESCPSGEYLDPNSCQCTAQTSCGSGETLCNGQCVSINCAYNQLFDDASCMRVARCSAGMDYCNDACIDVINDEMNCGFCGNTCPPGMPCIAGSCLCPVDHTYCASKQKCITGPETC